DRQGECLRRGGVRSPGTLLDQARPRMSLSLEACQEHPDRFEKGLVAGLLECDRPGADVEARVPGKVHTVGWRMAVERGLPVEGAGLVIGDLVLPQARGEGPARSGFELEAAIPQDPGPEELVDGILARGEWYISQGIPGHVLAPGQQVGLRRGRVMEEPG